MVLVACHWSAGTTLAQTIVTDSLKSVVDSIYAAMPGDSLLMQTDSLLMDDEELLMDDEEGQAKPLVIGELNRTKGMKQQRDWSTWRPNPQRALWLALVIPGGGQIYNRKYWKLPIVYGGFVGCIYAMMWNNMMYHDYAQAYLDIMDKDPNTASYNKFLHLGRQIDSTNEERYKTIFKSRKDRYRRWRDLSFFVRVGVYAISVIDAYVDAELSAFDLSKDLSMKVRPTVMGNGLSANPLYATSVGVNCSINF
ncbi:MAG: hypothetical protein IJ546_03435 [Prevotella sp.]|nr:hypothetical protein [Prevotella sp.]